MLVSYAILSYPFGTALWTVFLNTGQNLALCLQLLTIMLLVRAIGHLSHMALFLHPDNRNYKQKTKKQDKWEIKEISRWSPRHFWDKLLGDISLE